MGCSVGFTEPFGRAFQPPFATAGAAAAPPWWTAGGTIPAANCIAAYQPCGAASLTASYVNLANPGTYNAAPGTAPSWTAIGGWRFVAGTSAFLTTGITPGQGWSMAVQYANHVVGTVNGMVCGFDAATNRRFYLWPTTSGGNKVTYGEGNYKSVAPHLLNGNLIIAGQQGYRNAVADGAAIGSWAGDPTGLIMLGCGTGVDSVTPGQYWNGNIRALAIYNTNIAATVAALKASMDFVNGFSWIEATMGSGQAAVILLPDSYNAVTGAPLIMFQHGSGDTQLALTTSPIATQDACTQALLDAGYIIAISNAYGNNWGNDNGVAANNELYAYMAANYTITRVCAWSQSMGGLAGLNGVLDGTIPYKGWLGSYPVCNLWWMYTNGWNHVIDAAYGINGTPYAVATAGHDPVLHAANTYNGLRMRFYASAGDISVSKTDNSDQMAALVTGHATECDVVACTGTHGDPSHFQAADYLAFFNRCI